MKRRILIATLVTGLSASLAAGPVRASAEDQLTADAAIEGFAGRMAEAGGEAPFGPTEVTEIEPEDEANPDEPNTFGIDCFGSVASGLAADGHIDGETARATSERFAFERAEESSSTDHAETSLLERDYVAASVIMFDVDHTGTITDLVQSIGSDEIAECLTDAYQAQTMESQSSQPPDAPPVGELQVSAVSDLGIGDESSVMLFRFNDISGQVAATQSIYIARASRALVLVSVSTGTEPVSDLDGEAELADFVNSL